LERFRIVININYMNSFKDIAYQILKEVGNRFIIGYKNFWALNSE